MVKPDRSIDPLLRRPFSVFEILRDGNRPVGVSILSKRVGITTAQIFDAEAGQRVQCLGPLGRAFTLPDPTTRCLDGRRRRRPGPVLDGRRDVGRARRDAHALLRRAARRRLVLSGLLRAARRHARVVHRRRIARRARPRDHSARTRAGRASGRPRGLAPCLRPRTDAGGCRAAGRAVRLPLRGVGGTRHGLRAGRLLQLRRSGQGRTSGFHHVRSCIGGPIFDAATLVWD